MQSSNNTFLLDIVSAEKSLFSGRVRAATVSGKLGEVGILPGHSPLLTELKPGNVEVILENGDADVFYISGGILEIQPFVTTVLADTGVRAHDIDEAAALEAKQKAEHLIATKRADIDYARASSELAQAAAMLQAIKLFRKKHK